MPATDAAGGALAAFPPHAATAGIFTDFDGTLAPIVDDPAAARPLPGAVEVLAALARRYRRVGVVSGRPGEFLARHLGGRGLLLSGLYGLERVGAQGVRAHPEAASWRAVVGEAADLATAELPPTLLVERKGLSVTLHFRTDPDREAEAASWARARAAATGLVVHRARKSYELRPPLAHGKGLVLAEAAAGLTHACFVGDDQGDLEAFDTLDRLAAGGVATARVAVASAEAPAELRRRADVVVEGPAGVVNLLRAL